MTNSKSHKRQTNASQIFYSMRITEDVRKYAVELGIAEEEALKKGMEENPASSPRRAVGFTRRSKNAQLGKS